MCRLTALTATNIPAEIRRLLLDRLMLASNADTQRDGWGVTDGDFMIKGAGDYYNQDDLRWQYDLNPATTFIGHVRYASPGTLLRTEEAHPFEFTNWFGAHNGGFDPVTLIKDKPQSDTWTAFNTLATKYGGALNPDTIATWLEEYSVLSKFVLYFLDKHTRQLHVIRNDWQREMFFVRCGNGYMLNTSISVLKSTRAYGSLLNVEFGDTIYYVPERTYMWFNPGAEEYAMIPFEYNLKPVTPGATKAFFGLWG